MTFDMLSRSMRRENAVSKSVTSPQCKVYAPMKTLPRISTPLHNTKANSHDGNFFGCMHQLSIFIRLNGHHVQSTIISSNTSMGGPSGIPL